MSFKEDRPMKTSSLLAAAILGAALFTACEKEKAIEMREEIPTNVPEGSLWLSLDASKGSGADTKALSLDDSGATDVLNAHWKDGEQVAVYINGTFLGFLTADALADPSKATLSGTINDNSGIVPGAEFVLLFPRATWDYTGQKGSLTGTGSIEDTYDYMMATVTVAGISGTTVTTTTTASFENQQSIYRFGFKFGGAPLNVKAFTVSSNRNKLVTSRSYSGGWNSTYGSLSVTPAAATSGLLYLSLRNENTNTGQNDMYSFSVIGDDDVLYLGHKSIPGDKLGYGKFISAKNVSVDKAQVHENYDQTNEVW